MSDGNRKGANLEEGTNSVKIKGSDLMTPVDVCPLGGNKGNHEARAMSAASIATASFVVVNENNRRRSETLHLECEEPDYGWQAPNINVLALWAPNSQFYPARIISLSDDKVQIQYDDGVIKSLRSAISYSLPRDQIKKITYIVKSKTPHLICPSGGNKACTASGVAEDECENGYLKFEGFLRRRDPICRYVICNLKNKSNPNSIVRDIRNHWGLERPKLIISVVGGHSKSPLTSRRSFMLAFKQAIAKVATLEGVWILTLGTDVGTTELIGEAIAEHISAEGEDTREKIHLIGVSDHSKLFPPESSNSGGLKQEKSLEPNHTHFIWVKNASEDYEWRRKLEDTLSDASQWPNGANTKIPRVYLLLNGGKNSLKFVNELISGKTDRQPIIVIKGSAGASDLVVKLEESRSAPDKETIKSTITDAGDELTDEKVKEVHETLEEMNKDDILHYVTIYDFRSDSTQELHEEIINALKKLRKFQNEVEEDKKSNTLWECIVDLARAWNCFDDADIAEVVTNEKSKYFFFTSLVNGNDKFVDSMLDHLGDRAPEYVNGFITAPDSIPDYHRLYQKGEENGWASEFMSKFLASFGENTGCLEKAGRALAELLGDEYDLPKSFRNRTPRCSYFENCFACGCTKSCTIQNVEPSTPEKNKEESKDGKQKEENEGSDEKEGNEYIQYLFFWAVLFDRFSTAKTLLKYTKNPIVGALVGASLYKRMEDRSKSKGAAEVTDIFHNNSQKFLKMANDLLTICWERNRNLTIQMLTSLTPSWGGKSAIVLAHSYEHQSFLAQAASFAALSREWRGGISLTTASWKIFLFTIIPVSSLLKFDEKVGEEGETECNVRCMRGYDAPIVRFIWSLGWYFGFLAAYSIFVLCELCDPGTTHDPTKNQVNGTGPLAPFTLENRLFNISLYNQMDKSDLSYCYGVGIFELATWIGVASLFIEEIYEFFMKKERNHRRLWPAAKDWFVKDHWNILEAVNFISFVIAVGLRFRLGGKQFQWVRAGYTLGIAGWYFKLLHTFNITKVLGPKVTMIKEMVRDVVFFMFILVIMLFSFGIMYQGLLNPQQPFGWELVRNVLSKPYFQIYGELYLDELVTGDNATLVSGGLVVVYLILTNILLLNLLIAMFSHTFARIQDEAKTLWRFNYFDLVDEYMDKSYIPPMSAICCLIKLMFGKCKVHEDQQQDQEKQCIPLLCRRVKKPFMVKEEDGVLERIHDLLGVAMHKFNLENTERDHEQEKIEQLTRQINAQIIHLVQDMHQGNPDRRKHP